MTPEEVALQREFGTQYLADEMPVFTDHFVRGVLPRWARSSASSLAVGNADAMLLLLERLRARPDDPFVEVLSKASGVEWSEDWEVFQTLLAHIARGIEARRRNEALGMGFNVFRQTDGDQHHYVLADEETGAEILKVQEPQLTGRLLRVVFESNDPKLGSGRAAIHIEKHLLRKFLLDRFGGLADYVDYIEANGETGVRLPYPSELGAS